jgi:hypothetical protein
MLTNTLKVTHRNEQNTSQILYLVGEEFHTPHALSLFIFHQWIDYSSQKIGIYN